MKVKKEKKFWNSKVNLNQLENSFVSLRFIISLSVYLFTFTVNTLIVNTFTVNTFTVN